MPDNGEDFICTCSECTPIRAQRAGNTDRIQRLIQEIRDRNEVCSAPDAVTQPGVEVEAPPPRPRPTKAYNGFNPDRLFGIEIESVGWSRRALSRVRDASYDYVQISQDGSINVHPFYPNGGREIKIGPVDAAIGFNLLRDICNIMRDNHVSVNRSCGLHVHHDLPNGFPGRRDKAVRIAQVYARFAPAIELFFRPNRWQNGYARSMLHTHDYELQATGQDYLDRYWAVNAPTGHGTVEFRQHHGTVSYDRIVNWVKFTNMLTEYAESAGCQDLTWEPEPHPMRAMWKALVRPGDVEALNVKQFYTREMARLAKSRMAETPFDEDDRETLLAKKNLNNAYVRNISVGGW